MSTAPTTERKKTRQVTSANEFRKQATTIAYAMLADWVGEERAREATGRIAVAVAASAAAAKNPSDFYRCTPQSVATCIATAALTGIMPSTGSAALAYLIPQPPRRNEPPQLQYMLSHRGLNALARRCGQVMIAVPISYTDKIKTDDFGQFQVASRDIDNPPTTEQELRGVLILVREIATGMINTAAFVPKKLIEERRNVSKSAKSDFSPWNSWYVEMAMKTAMHYAISRGWCVVDDTEAVRALKMDADMDLALEDKNTVDAVKVRGIAMVEQRLGIEQTADSQIFKPSTDAETVTVDQQQETNTTTDGTADAGDKAAAEAPAVTIERELRSKLDSATSSKKLEGVKWEIMAADLDKETKNVLLDLFEERYSMALDEEGRE